MRKLFLVLGLLLACAGASRAQTAPPNNPSGSGTPHGVALSWSASATTTVVGYSVYRATASAGPFVRVNSALISGLSYEDLASNLAVSTTYFYVATAVDASGNESVFSNQVSVTTPATFPANPQAPVGLAGKNQ